MTEIENNDNTPLANRPSVKPQRSIGWRESYTQKDVQDMIEQLHRSKSAWPFESTTRLYRDNTGRVASALNELKSTHPEGVLFYAGQAATLANHKAEDQTKTQVQDFSEKQARWYADIASTVDNLVAKLWDFENTNAPPGAVGPFAPIYFRGHLVDLVTYLREQAAFYGAAPKRLGISQKVNDPNADAILALRHLREKLHGTSKNVKHTPLVHLVSVATGIEISRSADGRWPGWVTEALRPRVLDVPVQRKSKKSPKATKTTS